MKRIVILGSTGSIGTQALDIIRQHPDKFKVVGLTANSRIDILEGQVKEFAPTAICVTDGEKERELRTRLEGSQVTFLGLNEIATLECNLLINALVGSAGLIPTLEAIRKGTTIGLANKETLVMAGEIVMREAAKHQVTIIPIDSEHSALFQSLKSGKAAEVRHLILTMGKGKIAEMDEEALRKVTLKDIFSRPAWNMGDKVTIDSATCMNKTFEIIEARWLFGVNPSQIKVIVHPDYICHSLVEFHDGSIITEFGTADMRRYTQYALFYPERIGATVSSFIDLHGKALRFERPAYEKFPCLGLGHKVLEMGGIMPATLHGADHVAVEAFKEGKIGFMDIPTLITQTLKRTENIQNPDIYQIIEAEKNAQITAKEILSVWYPSSSQQPAIPLDLVKTSSS